MAKRDRDGVNGTGHISAQTLTYQWTGHLPLYINNELVIVEQGLLIYYLQQMAALGLVDMTTALNSSFLSNATIWLAKHAVLIYCIYKG